MVATGVGTLGAKDMGHLPVSGPNGSLQSLTQLSAALKVYLHINNTNPMLRDDSSERQTVEAAGVIVGNDGQEFVL